MHGVFPHLVSYCRLGGGSASFFDTVPHCMGLIDFLFYFLFCEQMTESVKAYGAVFWLSDLHLGLIEM